MLVAVVLLGCHSTELRGAGTDGDHRDTVTDPGADHWIPPDAPPDGAADPSWEPLPDPIPDGTGECGARASGWGYFVIDDTEWPWESVDWDLECTMNSAGGEPGLLTLFIDCFGGRGAVGWHKIQLSALPYVGMGYFPGEMRLRYVADTSRWGSRWFVLSGSGGRVVFAGIDADNLLAPGWSTESYLPLGIAPTFEGCPVEAGDCWDTQRLGVDVAWDSGRERVFDGNEVLVGAGESYRFILNTAEYHHDAYRCGDRPEQWFDVLILSNWD